MKDMEFTTMPQIALRMHERWERIEEPAPGSRIARGLNEGSTGEALMLETITRRFTDCHDGGRELASHLRSLAAEDSTSGSINHPSRIDTATTGSAASIKRNTSRSDLIGARILTPVRTGRQRDAGTNGGGGFPRSLQSSLMSSSVRSG